MDDSGRKTVINSHPINSTLSPLDKILVLYWLLSATTMFTLTHNYDPKISMPFRTVLSFKNTTRILAGN